MSRRIRFVETRAEGVLRPIRHGRIAYPALRGAPSAVGCAGFTIIEQERVSRDISGPQVSEGTP